jgi:hypothetical protein
VESGSGKGEGVRHATLIREVNERIREVSGRVEAFEVLCECGRPGCDRTVEVTAARWEEIRSAERVFVVAPGHEPAESAPAEIDAVAAPVAALPQ